MRLLRLVIISLVILGCSVTNTALADDGKVLNIYAWGGEVPDDVVQSFEKETGINVHLSTYDSNETLFAKITAVGNPGYDIIEPSTYYVSRLARLGFLLPLDKSKLANWHYLNPELLNKEYDPGQRYSIPHLWGITGIFVNDQYYDPNKIHRWSDLWNPKYRDSLLLLNDVRDVFSLSLFTLHADPNTSDPKLIKQAYKKLAALHPNIKLFITDAVIAIITDEDANIGMVWNGDAFKAMAANPHIHFIYPEDGYSIWMDNFAIPKGAPHINNAYLFLNYIMRPEVSARITEEEGYPTANAGALALLPESYRNNPVAFPTNAIIEKGTFQDDIPNEAVGLYAHYWELLKLG